MMGDLGGAIAAETELASFHTVSKGVLGECGLRGGYVELTNFHPGTVDELYKVGWVWCGCVRCACAGGCSALCHAALR